MSEKFANEILLFDDYCYRCRRPNAQRTPVCSSGHWSTGEGIWWTKTGRMYHGRINSIPTSKAKCIETHLSEFEGKKLCGRCLAKVRIKKNQLHLEL